MAEKIPDRLLISHHTDDLLIAESDIQPPRLSPDPLM
jgi:hypothetical protein